MRREYIVGTCFLVILTSAALAVWFVGVRRGRQPLVLAAGPDGGTYSRIARGFSEACRDNPNQKLELDVLVTTGSGRNPVLVAECKVDIGIVQSSLPESKSLRAIAPLYREFLHIIVRRDSSIASPWQLAGKRVAFGEKGSGTRAVGEILLHHYGVSQAAFVDIDDDPQTAADKLLAGEIDMFVLVAALHTPVIEKLAATGEVRFLSFGASGAADGLTRRFPYLRAAEIPAHTYPCTAAGFPAVPSTPVQTLSLTSLLLICHCDLDKGLVHRLNEVRIRKRRLAKRAESE